MKTRIEPCPCGETPKELSIFREHDESKWAIVYGSCCGEWMIEFRANHLSTSDPKFMELARNAWNAAPRASRK